MTAIGCWSATTGLAEAARRSVAAACRAGVEVSLEDIPYWAPMEPSRFPPNLRALPAGRLHDTEVCYFNINEVGDLTGLDLRKERPAHHTIGSWFWELGSLPSNLVADVERVDEVWAPTQFVRNMFLRHGKTEVTIMPCVVEPTINTGLTRRDFGLPDRPCTFLFHFDAHSTFARKNPFGIIDAYRQAFGSRRGRTDVQLVMKVLNLARLPEARALLRRELEGVGGILIEHEMASDEVAALVKLCDVYVSLHRAEGFGLGIAEAMYFEKPVIATAFSGPEDFLTPSNSCMVGYRERTISPGDLYLNPGMGELYEVGKSWAEPDITQAARWMRLLAKRSEVRRTIGEEAGRTIRRSYSTLAAGTAIRNRLSDISKAMRAGVPVATRPMRAPALLHAGDQR